MRGARSIRGKIRGEKASDSSLMARVKRLIYGEKCGHAELFAAEPPFIWRLERHGDEERPMTSREREALSWRFFIFFFFGKNLIVLDHFWIREICFDEEEDA